MSQGQKRKHAPNQEPNQDDSTIVFRSSTIEDRSSRFTAVFSPSLSARTLQKLPEISSASHKILAWRRPGNQQLLLARPTPSSTNTVPRQVIYDIGHDDDGEEHAGKKVAKVLENLSVVGSCVVARWWGGTLLGPVRFAHIENVAAEAVKNWQESEREEQRKKRKVEEDVRDRERLVVVLAQRDQSIVALRELAAEKEERVKRAIVEGVEELGEETRDSRNGHQENVVNTLEGKEDEKSMNGNSSLGKQVTKMGLDYATMPVERLRTLERARDATLSFLLKRIDKAEENLAALEAPKNPA